MKLSVSKIQEYEKCPYSFYLTNIAKEKPLIVPPQLKEGAEKHEIFDKIFSKVEKENFILDTLKKEIKRFENYEKYRQDCDNFIQFCELIEKKGGNITPKFRELKIYDEDFDIAGIIDRVDFDNGNILILDYKTGSPHSFEEFYFQLAVYVLLFEKEVGKKATHWAILFTKTNTLLIEKVKREEVEKAKEKIKTAGILIELAEKNNNFPKHPNHLCKWCTWYINNKCDGK